MCSESSWLFGFTDSREEDAMAGMLWCEQWWTLLPALSDSCSSAREQMKWLLSVTWLHTICFHFFNWLHPRWKWTKHPFPNMKSRPYKCSRGGLMFLLFHMLFLSCYQQHGARLYRKCHTSKPSHHCHLLQCGWRESGKEGAFHDFQDWKNNCL